MSQHVEPTGPGCLQAREVGVDASERALLREVSFTLGRGELLLVRGPSGSGKTTLLRALAGLIDAARGRVLLDERDAGAWGWPNWRRHVAYLPQQPVMFPGTVHENLLRPFSYRLYRGLKLPRMAYDWLDRLGLPAARLTATATTLSVGEQQRVALVRTLATAPRVVLLDEPTSALDDETRAAAEALVRDRAHETGLAALIVSHDSQQAARLDAAQLDLSSHQVREGAP